MSFLFSALLYISLLLQGFFLFLLRGSYRRYSFLGLYCFVQLAMVGIEGFVFLDSGVNSVLYRNLYWTTDVVLDLLLFLAIITMTYAVLEGSPLKPAMGKALGVVVAAALLLPFALFSNPFSSYWFNHTSQMLSFGAAIMDLVLWTAILSQRKRDSRLLTLSAGLGVAATGVAISYGIEMVWPARWELSNVFMSVTHVASLVIWCWAFRPSTRDRATGSAPDALPEHS